jgi:CheY-like chemotaxis protein
MWANKKILIAEDEDMNYTYLAEALFDTKANIIRATNGKQVLDIMGVTKDIDLILMDIKMPEMSGYEAILKIREMKSKVPIIAQTAYAMHGERQMILEAGCNDYIAKPIKYDDLIKIIQKWIS